MNNRELPIGFTMSLAMDELAMANYAKLDQSQKQEIIDYISSPGPGDEPKQRIDDIISSLHNLNGF